MYTRVTAIVLILLGMLWTAESAQKPPAGRKIAVLVGVNGYSNKPFPDLQFAERDMQDLKVVLEKAGFEVIMLLGSKTGKEEANRQNIVKRLIDRSESNPLFAFRDVGKNDTVLIAFSGHGEQIEVDEEVDGKLQKREVPFFCPKRAETGQPDTQINLNEVLKALGTTKAGNSLVLVDACRKYAERPRVPLPGGQKRGAAIDRATVQNLGSNIAVMLACGDRQEALEHPKAGEGHGLFFFSVLEAFRTAPRNDEGHVTWESMVPVIRAKVIKLADELDPTTPAERRQRPQHFSNLSNDPVLVVAGAQREPRPGEERSFEIADGVKMVFCWIPAGKATLGSPAREQLRSDDEKEHEFETKGFWLGKYAVTQQEWSAVGAPRAKENYFSSKGEGKASVDGLDTSRYPAESISWDECQVFLERLNGRDGTQAVFAGKGKFVLPDEDKWEYAYRGGLGNKRPFYWGEMLNGDKANCNGNNPYGTTTKGEYKQRPMPVGSYESKAPHPWGLCDMSGNVWQWCDNLHTTGETYRVLRGGSWSYGPRYCRAACRYGSEPGYRLSSIGFRVAFRLDL